MWSPLASQLGVWFIKAQLEDHAFQVWNLLRLAEPSWESFENSCRAGLLQMQPIVFGCCVASITLMQGKPGPQQSTCRMLGCLGGHAAVCCTRLSRVWCKRPSTPSTELAAVLAEGAARTGRPVQQRRFQGCICTPLNWKCAAQILHPKDHARLEAAMQASNMHSSIGRELDVLKAQLAQQVS